MPSADRLVRKDDRRSSAEGRMVIVIVDDEPDAREMARLVLQRRGHEVHTARHPDEALQILARTKVDVVLSDLHMPRMDGVTLARTIAQVHPDVPCLVWSALGEDAEAGVRTKDVMRLEIEEWLGEDAEQTDVVIAGAEGDRDA